MKTQIIRRLSLVVIALFIVFNNNGSTVQEAAATNNNSSSISINQNKTGTLNLISLLEQGNTQKEHELHYHQFDFIDDDKNNLPVWKSKVKKVLTVFYNLFFLNLFTTFYFITVLLLK